MSDEKTLGEERLQKGYGREGRSRDEESGRRSTKHGETNGSTDSNKNNLEVTSSSSRPLSHVYSIAIHYCHLNPGLPGSFHVFIVDQSTMLQDYSLSVVVCSVNLCCYDSVLADLE
jgi:hypothetical protein